MRPVLLKLLPLVSAAPPPAGYSRLLQPHATRRKSEVDIRTASDGVDISAAVNPDECMCCEKTLKAMQAYCLEQLPMGDLNLNNFSCAKEMGSQITFTSTSAQNRWSATQSCKCDCDARLAQLRMVDCPMICKRLPFECPVCTPPPPPPPPPPPVIAGHSYCKEVSKPCCEAVMNELEKFCYSFNPQGSVVKVPDPTHWDGGLWVPPASFDPLCNKYTPPQCGPCGALACPQTLQLLGHDFHPNLCDAVKVCDNFCDNQCPAGKNATAANALIMAVMPNKEISCVGASCNHPLPMQELPGSP